jgi:hypothetical protein
MISALVAVLALAAAQGANAATVGDLVSGITSSCPEVAGALSDPNFSILQAALTAAADVEVPAVDGKKEVVIAPTNQAFEALFQSAGVTPEEFIASDLFGPTLLAHIAVATNNGASTAGTLTGSQLRFYLGDDTTTKLPLMQIPVGVSETAATVQGPMNKVPISSVINCGGNKYVMVAGDVVKPKAAGSSKAPAAAPVSDVLDAMEPTADADVPMPDMVMPDMVMPPMDMPPLASEVVAEIPAVPDVAIAPSPEEVPEVTAPVVPEVTAPVVASAAVSVKAVASCAAALVAAALF